MLEGHYVTKRLRYAWICHSILGRGEEGVTDFPWGGTVGPWHIFLKEEDLVWALKGELHILRRRSRGKCIDEQNQRGLKKHGVFQSRR